MTIGPPGLVMAVFALSRIIFALNGIRMDGSALATNGTWQLLAIDQLHHHLVRSIWNLNSQPPLFNLASGMMLKLPHFALMPAMYLVSLSLGAALSLSTLYLCLELGVARPLATVIAAIVTIDPANILYQNWYFYSYPTALIMTMAALALSRYVRTRRRIWATVYSITIVALALTNTTFQWFWVVLVAAPVLVSVRPHWRKFLAAAALPVLVMVGWYVKNGVMFGTTTTSGWLGMNMARITTMTGPPSEMTRLVKERRLSPLAQRVAFQTLAYYPRPYQQVYHTGVPVLDDLLKPGGYPNFNNPAYIKLSDAWLRDDLNFIQDDPAHYLSNVWGATRVFFVPADQYQFLEPNAERIDRYARIFHVAIDWQLATTNTATVNTDVSKGMVPSMSHLALTSLLAFVLLVVGTPSLVWRRRLSTHAAATMSFIWISCCYVVVLTSLTELGENERFRYDLGALPLVAATVVVGVGIRGLRSRRLRRDDGLGTLPQETGPTYERGAGGSRRP